MHYEDMETFMEICRQEGISQAANRMYLAQSTVSQRLQRLEQKIGGPLFIRKPGTKKIQLTPLGEAFYPLVKQMVEISRDMENLIHHASTITLSLGSVTSLYDTILPKLILHISEMESNVRFVTTPRSSQDLYSMVEDKRLDAAFSPIDSHSSAIDCHPAFQEKFYLVCTRELLEHETTTVDVGKLDFSKELYFSWGPIFREWHEKLYTKNTVPNITVDTIMAYYQIATKRSFWSVCPASVVCFLLEMNLDINIFNIYNPPQARTIYLIRPHKTSEALDLFERYLPPFIANLEENFKFI